MSPWRRPFEFIAALLVAVTTGTLVLVAGNAVVGGESPDTTPVATGPTTIPIPSISAEDRARIQAEIDAIVEQTRQNPYPSPDPNATPRPSPTPPVIRIGEATLQLPEGVEYGEVIWATNPNPGRLLGANTHVDGGGTRISRLYIDPLDGNIVRSSILPEHEALFAPILQWLDQLNP